LCINPSLFSITRIKTRPSYCLTSQQSPVYIRAAAATVSDVQAFCRNVIAMSFRSFYYCIDRTFSPLPPVFIRLCSLPTCIISETTNQFQDVIEFRLTSRRRKVTNVNGSGFLRGGGRGLFAGVLFVLKCFFTNEAGLEEASIKFKCFLIYETVKFRRLWVFRKNVLPTLSHLMCNNCSLCTTCIATETQQVPHMINFFIHN
jgi:hypothetical protein